MSELATTETVSKEELDKFLDSNDVDDNAGKDLRGCPAEVQKIVLSRGDLSSARNPSAALIARIRDARTSVFSGHHVPGGGDKASIDPQVEEFIKANKIDDSAAASLRGSPLDVQKCVLARGELTGARNPSSALLSRIRDAKAAPAGGAMVVPGPHGYGLAGMPMGAIPPPPGGYGYGGYAMPPPPPGYPPSYGYGQAAYYGMYGYPYGAYPGMPGYPPPPPTGPGYGDYGAPPGGEKRGRSRDRCRSDSPADQSSSGGSSSSSSRSCSKARRGKEAAKTRRRGGRRKKRAKAKAKSASASRSKERAKSPSSSPSRKRSASVVRKKKRR